MEAILDVPKEKGSRVWFQETPFPDMRPHRHEELELNLVVSGTARYLLGSRSYVLRQGTLVWLFPNQQHILLDQSADLKVWLAVFTPALVREFCPKESNAYPLQSNDPLDDFSRIISSTECTGLSTLFHELESFSDEPELYRLGLVWLLRMAWKRWEPSTLESNFSDIHPAVEKTLCLLQEDSTLALPDLARQAGLSPSQLSRVFKTAIGHTISSYRNYYRIQSFIKLYGNGQRRTLLDCALDAGFGSYEQFHRTFKSKKGCSPSEYKRQLTHAQSHRVKP